MTNLSFFALVLVVLCSTTVCHAAFSFPRSSRALWTTKQTLSRQTSANLEEMDAALPASKERKGPSQPTMIIVGCLLAMNSGYLNAIALSGALVVGLKKQAVAAVTGAYTTGATTASAPPTDSGMTQLYVIVAYAAGSSLNGLLNSQGSLSWLDAPFLALAPLPLAAALLLIAQGCAIRHLQQNLHPRYFWCTLAATIGLQNSWTSSLMSGNIIRTGHMSGMTSDLGTFMGQLLRGNTKNAWKMGIFSILLGCFALGGYLSVPALKNLGFSSMKVSFYLYIGLFLFLSLPKYGETESQ